MPVFLPEGDDLLDLGDASQASLEVDCASMPPLRQGEGKISTTASMGLPVQEYKFFNSSLGECSPEVWTLILLCRLGTS